MGEEFAPIDPASYPEDWDVLTDKVLNATWRTPIPGREIKVVKVTVDTGGEAGKNADLNVTLNAYAWFRRVRALGMSGRVMLYKGASEPKAPLMKETWQGKRKLKDKGDVPVYMCNPNLLSDAVDAGLRRDSPGPNYIHFPPPRHPETNPDGWVTQAFFDELQAEVRGPNGTWQKMRKRNETFDLCRMIRAGALRLGLDKIKDWNVVPPHLAPLELNSMVVTVEDRREMKANETVAVETPEAERPAVRLVNAPRKSRRRSIPSTYV
jgi:phage terminase large subunit GpA-like protein